MKVKQYCFRDVTFPTEAYMGYVTILKGEEILLFYPLDSIFTSFEEYQVSVKQFAQQFSVDGLAVSDTGLLAPITFQKRFPLKEEYWQKPTTEYTTEQRVRLFGSAANLHQMYKVLITPSITAKKARLHAAIPFFISATDTDVAQFMYTADFPVDESAKDAAIYMLDKPVPLNWVTGEVIKQNKVTKVWENH